MVEVFKRVKAEYEEQRQALEQAFEWEVEVLTRQGVGVVVECHGPQHEGESFFVFTRDNKPVNLSCTSRGGFSQPEVYGFGVEDAVRFFERYPK